MAEKSNLWLKISCGFRVKGWKFLWFFSTKLCYCFEGEFLKTFQLFTFSHIWRLLKFGIIGELAFYHLINSHSTIVHWIAEQMARDAKNWMVWTLRGKNILISRTLNIFENFGQKIIKFITRKIQKSLKPIKNCFYFTKMVIRWWTGKTGHSKHNSDQPLSGQIGECCGQQPDTERRRLIPYLFFGDLWIPYSS